MQQLVQRRQRLVAPGEKGRCVERRGGQPRQRLIRQPGDGFQVRHGLRHGGIAVPRIARQRPVEEIRQFPVKSVLVFRTGEGRLRIIIDGAAVAIEGRWRPAPQRVKQHRAQAVHIRMPAQPVDLPHLQLQRRKPSGIGDLAHLIVLHRRHGDQRVEVEQLHQIGAAIQYEYVFRLQIEIQIPGLMNPLQHPSRAGQQGHALPQARAAMRSQRPAV